MGIEEQEFRDSDLLGVPVLVWQDVVRLRDAEVPPRALGARAGRAAGYPGFQAAFSVRIKKSEREKRCGSAEENVNEYE